jgi:CBS domain-containing protein
MKIMLASDIIRRQGRPVETIQPDRTVQEAINRLVERRIGSLLVVDDEWRIVGIVTERDILRASYTNSPRPERVRVEEIMTRNPVVGTPDDPINDLLTVMTENRIRHLPIMRGGRLEGLVSIGDLVAAQLDQIQDENLHLKAYIEGR